MPWGRAARPRPARPGPCGPRSRHRPPHRPPHRPAVRSAPPDLASNAARRLLPLKASGGAASPCPLLGRAGGGQPGPFPALETALRLGSLSKWCPVVWGERGKSCLRPCEMAEASNSSSHRSHLGTPKKRRCQNCPKLCIAAIKNAILPKESHRPHQPVPGYCSTCLLSCPDIKKKAGFPPAPQELTLARH